MDVFCQLIIERIRPLVPSPLVIQGKWEKAPAGSKEPRLAGEGWITADWRLLVSSHGCSKQQVREEEGCQDTATIIIVTMILASMRIRLESKTSIIGKVASQHHNTKIMTTMTAWKS